MADDEDGGGFETGSERVLRRMQGAGHVDQMVRMAVQTCWQALPQKRKTIDELAAQMRRLLDRAIRDLREDEEAFELGD